MRQGVAQNQREEHSVYSSYGTQHCAVVPLGALEVRIPGSGVGVLVVGATVRLPQVKLSEHRQTLTRGNLL